MAEGGCIETSVDFDPVYICLNIVAGKSTTKKFVEYHCNSTTVGQLLSPHLSETVLKVTGSRKSDHGDPVELDLFTPCRVLRDFGISFLEATLQISKESQTQYHEQDSHHPSVFDMLMNANRHYNKLPEPRSNPCNAKDTLFNDILKVMEHSGVGFTSIQVTSLGERVVKTLTDVIWYLDPHIDLLESRAIRIPPMFASFRGCYQWRLQKKKKPVVVAPDLERHINVLSDLIMVPWMHRFDQFRATCVALCDGMKKYHTFLMNQAKRTAAVHHTNVPVRSLTDSWSTKLVDGGKSVADQYKRLATDLSTMENYMPLELMEYVPVDRYDRRKWLTDIKLEFPIQRYTHTQGNYLGNLEYVWKVDPDDRQIMEDRNLAVFSMLKESLPVYSTRQMRKSFTPRYIKFPQLKPIILRDMYRFLTDDMAAADSAQIQQADDRFVDFLLHCDDTELIFDLRKHNGRAKNADFDPFWEELQKYLDENTAVHERRHTNHMYMPFAISVRDLINTIESRLPANTAIPSLSLVRLNFWPANAYVKSAAHYTGRFHVKYKVQQRLLRGQHVDAGYVGHQFAMMKELAVKLRKSALFICLDDKSTIPIGEPDTPISTGARAHNKGLVSCDKTLAAADHDFHVCGAVPSVMLIVDIPENCKDSFYKGNVHVTVKDKIFQPSSAMRHSAEVINVLRHVDSSDAVNLNHPVLFTFTDGGPDHRTNYWTVQCAAIAMFLALDLDLYIAVRTAPMQSYCNPAERVMSLLNLALQNVSTSREKMTETMECRFKPLSNLKAIRDWASRQPNLKTAILGSTLPVRQLLQHRFSRLKWTENQVAVHEAATDDWIEELAELILILDVQGEGLTVDACLADRKTATRFACLSDFISKHCRTRHYTFQIKKCFQPDCPYCTLNPPRLTEEELHWLPDPVLGPDKAYLPLSDVYNQDADTTDDARPSLKDRPGNVEADKVNKGVLIGAKVRATVTCSDCGKKRVVYSRAKPSTRDLNVITRLEEELTYTCGSRLLPSGESTFVVREGMTCASPIETTYYAGITQVFEDICYYCGDSEVDDGLEVAALKQQYSIVRPICAACLAKGLQPATRNALKMKKTIEKKK